jgi:hypothetical protein
VQQAEIRGQRLEANDDFIRIDDDRKVIQMLRTKMNNNITLENEICELRESIKVAPKQDAYIAKLQSDMRMLLDHIREREEFEFSITTFEEFDRENLEMQLHFQLSQY